MKHEIVLACADYTCLYRVGEVVNVGYLPGMPPMRVIGKRCGKLIVQPASYRWKRGKVQRKHKRQARVWREHMDFNDFERSHDAISKHPFFRLVKRGQNRSAAPLAHDRGNNNHESQRQERPRSRA